MSRKLIDLTGIKFGRLQVLNKAASVNAGTLWSCVCECGNEKDILGHLLRRGQVKSCGCQRREAGRENIKKASLVPHPALKHGEAKQGLESVEWKTWNSIKQRCKKSPDYVSLGILICDRWKESFSNFLADMGRRPSPSHSIDRIDVTGNYEPGNCRWATRKEQARNRRNSLFIEAFGLRLTLAEWAERTGIKNTTIRNRIKYGWDAEKALTKDIHAGD